MLSVTVALLSIIATHGLSHDEIADASQIDKFARRSMNNGLRGTETTGMVTSDRRRQLGSTKSALYGKYKEDRIIAAHMKRCIGSPWHWKIFQEVTNAN